MFLKMGVIQRISAYHESSTEFQSSFQNHAQIYTSLRFVDILSGILITAAYKTRDLVW
jgi:hypothetical protein